MVNTGTRRYATDAALSEEVVRANWVRERLLQIKSGKAPIDYDILKGIEYSKDGRTTFYYLTPGAKDILREGGALPWDPSGHYN